MNYARKPRRAWAVTAAAVTVAGLLSGGVLAARAATSPSRAAPLPAPLAGQSLVTEFSPATLASSAWNPANQPGNCPTANNNAKVNASGFAEIDTNGATNDCRSMQSPQANLPTAPGTTYEALINFSSFADWPAIWMYGPNWPDQGEIDAVEGGPGVSSVTWHQAGNRTIGGDPWDNQQVPFAGGPDIQPGVWTTVDISYTATGADIYYQGQLYIHIPESVTTGGNDPMYLTISEGSCNAEGVNVCNGGTSPAGSVQVQWVREFSSSGSPGPSPSPTTPAPVPTQTTPTPAPAPACPTAAPAAAPGGFRADVRGSHVVLTWKPVPGATLYEVTVSTPDGRAWRDSVTAQASATYSPVPATGRYKYKVRAINAVGNGPWSAVQAFTVLT